MKTPFYLDIETIPGQSDSVRADLQARANAEIAELKAPANYKKEEAIAEYIANATAGIIADMDGRYRKTALDGTYGQVLTISYALGMDEPTVLQATSLHPRHQASLLEKMVQDVTKFSRAGVQMQFVGHNIAEFDLPFLRQRMAILNVRPCAQIPFGQKPWSELIYDTMHEWDAKNRKSLATLCAVFDIPVKQGMTGKEVWDYAQRGEFEAIGEYCKADVIATRELHRRMTWATETDITGA